MKAFTNVEQSKILAEFLPLESADMDYIPIINIDGEYSVEVNEWDNEHNIEEGWIPCWSLSALLGLMPFQLIANNNRFGFYQVKGFNKQGETYRFGYKTNNNYFLFETSWYNDVIDAAFEMVVWLKENKKL